MDEKVVTVNMRTGLKSKGYKSQVHVMYTKNMR